MGAHSLELTVALIKNLLYLYKSKLRISAFVKTNIQGIYIRRGYENISIITLKKIADALDAKVDLNLVEVNKDIDINKPNHSECK